MSDLHVEFTHEVSQLSKSIAHTFEFVPVTDADLIVLAGDIWYQHHSIDWAAQLSRLHSKPVVAIFGNHDYWSVSKSTRRGIDACIKDMKALTTKYRDDGAEFYFLENDELIIDDVRFLGCTMWTSFNNANPFAMMKARSDMADYKAINGKVTPDTILARHKESKAWLTEELKKDFNGKTVVLTHHAPSSLSLSNWELHQHTAPAYYDQLESLMFDYKPDVWIHGHVHRVNDYMMDCTNVLSNTRGYHGEQVINDFNPGKIVEV